MGFLLGSVRRVERIEVELPLVLGSVIPRDRDVRVGDKWRPHGEIFDEWTVERIHGVYRATARGRMVRAWVVDLAAGMRLPALTRVVRAQQPAGRDLLKDATDEWLAEHEQYLVPGHDEGPAQETGPRI
jgi:hypothetical protein